MSGNMRAALVRSSASRPTLEMLELAGSLHDVGKQMISERIVEKPGLLTDAEWEAMRKHPELGEAYAREEGHPDDVGSWVRHHHERLDGTGYPDHLEGEEIPVGRASSPSSTRTWA